MGCATGWVGRTHGSCTVDYLLVSKILWAGFSRPGLGRETGDCALNLQSLEGIKIPESTQGMLVKNERAGRDSL